MIAPDALKRVRLWAEHGLRSDLSDLVAAVSHIDALEALLRRFVEISGSECRLDHHGYCQEHFVEKNCVVAETLTALGDKP